VSGGDGAVTRMERSGVKRYGPLVICGDWTLGWFRLFGVGLWWKNRARHDLWFSERHWIRPFDFAFGTWHFRFLRRARPL
jgi:hypothetical protein